MAGAIYDLPVPQGGAVAALPVPQQGTDTRAPEQQDADAFRMTAGTARRGFRAGMNSVGAMLNNLIGGSAEALGLTEFAQDRYEEAKHYADFSESVQPAVRDIGQVKDFNSMVEFVAGHAGSGAATSVPALATAAYLRRPIAGVMLGSGAIETGEQIGTLRDNPNVMATTSPGERLANAGIKGTINAALELGGASGIAARTVAKPTAKGMVKTVAHGIAGEGVTEGAQEVVGQVMEHQLDPSAQVDPNQTANAIAAGAAGGGGITAGAKAVSAVPGLLVDTADALKDRLGRKTPPHDPDSLPKEAFDPNTPVERVMELIGESEKKFTKGWEQLKARPEFAQLAEQFKDFDLTDPDKRTALFTAARKKFNFDEFGPKIEKAIQHVKDKYNEGTDKLARAAAQKVGEVGIDALAMLARAGGKKSLADTKQPDEVAMKVLNREPVHTGQNKDPKTAEFLAKNGYKMQGEGTWVPAFKRSEMSTKVDMSTRDDLMKSLPQNFKDAIDEKQADELADHLKKMALDPDLIERSATARVLTNVFAEPDENQPDRSAASVGRERMRDLLERTVDRVYSIDSVKADVKRAIRRAFKEREELDTMREDRVDTIVNTMLRPKYRASPELRKAAKEQLLPTMMDYIDGQGGFPAVWDAAADEAFGEKRLVVEEMLDEVRHEQPARTEDTHVDVPEEDVEAGTTAASGAASSPVRDVRVGEVIEGAAAAKSTLRALQSEYGERSVKFRLVPVKDRPHAFTIEADAADSEGLSEEDFKRVQEALPKDSDERRVYNRTGLSNGIMVVKTVDHPAGVKINIPNLTRMMMQREGQQTKEGQLEYVADMFARGMSALMAAQIWYPKADEGNGAWKPRVLDILRVKRLDDGSWDLPGDTPVAFTREVDANGQPKLKPVAGRDGKTEMRPDYRRWTYKEVYEAGFGLSKTVARLREEVRTEWQRYGRPEWEDRKGEKPKPLNRSAVAVQKLSDFYDGINDMAMRVHRMENDALSTLGDEGVESLEAAVAPMEAAIKEILSVEQELHNAEHEKYKKQRTDAGQPIVKQRRIAAGGPEVAQLRRAIARVENEAERMAKGEITVDTPVEFANEEARRQPPRGAFDETTGLPLHQEPAAGPRGPTPMADTRTAQKAQEPVETGGYISETEAARRGITTSTDELKIVPDERMANVLGKREGTRGAPNFKTPQDDAAKAEVPPEEGHGGQRGAGQDALKSAGLAQDRDTMSEQDVGRRPPDPFSQALKDAENRLNAGIAEREGRTAPPLEPGKAKPFIDAVESANLTRAQADLSKEFDKALAEKTGKRSNIDPTNIESVMDSLLTEMGGDKRGRWNAFDYTNAADWGKVKERRTSSAEMKTKYAEAARQLREKAAAMSKPSTQNVGERTKPMTAKKKAEIKDYLERVLGKDKVKAIFADLMDEAGKRFSGEFMEGEDGTELYKISHLSIDPMSVAFHEAMHGFFARLTKADPKAAQTLLRAAGSAPVVAKLRQLLKGHERALEQLGDPEEALAYMYQFWALGKKGLMPIGPQTKTWFDKVKSFVRVITGLWADELNSAMDMERTAAIVDAFHKGEFAERNDVAKVIKERFPADARETMDKAWPSLGKLMNKFLFTAQGAVRDMNIGPLNDIMDKFHTTVETSGKGPGWLQAKHVEFNQRLNKVAAVLRDLTEAQQQEILDELRSGQVRTSKEALAIEDVLVEAIGYMQGAGVMAVEDFDDKGKPIYRPVRQIKRSSAGDYYFPRVYDTDVLRSKKDEFVAMLKKNRVKNPEDVWAKLSEGLTNTDPREDAVLGVTLFTPNVNERTLASIPDRDLKPFLNQDLFGTMAQYLARAARRAEYTKRFGNAGERIEEAMKAARDLGMTAAQEQTVREAVKAMEGTLGANMSNALRQVYGGITTYQNIRLLPLALFSSLVDPLGIAVRGGSAGEAFEAFKRGITDLFKLNEDDAYHLAQTVGAINIANDAAVVGDMYSSQFMPAFQRNLNEKFFKYIGMESWNRSMRVAATAAAEGFIRRHTQAPTEDSTRYLAELGLTKDDVSVTDGKVDMNAKVVRAINLWVDQSILRPNAALRPIYMSDPHWILVSHLKQYTYMFQKVILARVYHELQHGNYSPAFALAGYVPMIIASDMLRMNITPGNADNNAKAGWTFWDWLWRGVQRAGFFGPGQFALDSASDVGHGRIGIESLAGPSFQQVADFVRGSAAGAMGTEAIKALPGGRFVL